MPIIINEIVIRALVNTKQKEAEKKGKMEKFEKEEVVMECVEQVLEILNEKEER